MTTPHYPQGCSAGSQVHGDASSSPCAGNEDYAWILNFNNGSTNWNHRDNHACVRAVRSAAPAAGEYQGAYERDGTVSFRSLFNAWAAARKGKRPGIDQLNFNNRALDRLVALREQLSAGVWTPSPTTCFIATKPKAREIHAPAFSDRVVHHWLVPQLEQIYEKHFVHDSFANRTGKGTHAAVQRLQGFVRQVADGQGGGYFLQLDIHNFFNSIHRGILYSLLKKRVQRAGLPLPAQWAAHALLRHSPVAQGVTYRATAIQRAMVPPHKRLEQAPPGCGLPIGNLSSQFFANVYLHELDTFIKHTLRAKRYVRYVDDFVLVHSCHRQLRAWQSAIEAFLAETLRLSLKPETKLQPLHSGIDFLGYVTFPRKVLVRKRVVDHARAAIRAWGSSHVSHNSLQATPGEFRRLASLWGSYEGHFQFAHAKRLRADFHRRFPWLDQAASRRVRFAHSAEGRVITIARRRHDQP